MRKEILVVHCLLLGFQIVHSSEDSMLRNSVMKRVTKRLKQGVQTLVSNSTKLNCLGIPETVLTNAVEGVFKQEAKAKDVKFYFYSQNNKELKTVQLENGFSLNEINYDIAKDTVFITHGFWSSGLVDWVQNMKDAFLELEDVNVVVVDWEKGSQTWNYLSASISTRIVGFQIAKLVQLIDEKSLESNEIVVNKGQLHLIGHSLGSHVSAHAAFLINEMKRNGTIDWCVRRITGLDPAQPCFTSAEESLKLDRSDADFVDVIHSNANPMFLVGFGLRDQLGHIDFYPNGGKVQLGCGQENSSFWSSINLPGTIIGDIKKAVCSHGRSYELFTDSIKVKKSGECRYYGHHWNQTDVNVRNLIAEKCRQKECPEMGINAVNYRNSHSGIFYVPTGDKVPYCKYNEDNIRAMERRLIKDQENENGIINKAVNKVVG